jgi:hypothetical protein
MTGKIRYKQMNEKTKIQAKQIKKEIERKNKIQTNERKKKDANK